MKKQNYSKTIRMPEQWHDWIVKFANQWNVPTSYVYRAAISEFIRSQSKQKI